MKLVILISCWESSSGFGGHYFSALTTARELSASGSDVHIVCVGEKIPETLSLSGEPVTFVAAGIGLGLGSKSGLARILGEHQPSVVIAFDAYAAALVRPHCVRQRIGIVLVKAGGPIPRRYFPRIKFQVHFTDKDRAWAEARVRGLGGMVECIPARVTEAREASARTSRLRDLLSLNETDLVVIRIGRISEKYRKAFLAAIRLVSVLRDGGLPARLIVIGDIESSALYMDILGAIGAQDSLLTDSEFTRDARQYLSLANINVGVGRGFMEGCAAGNFMFAVTANGELPVYVSDANFEHFKHENFSLRATSSHSEKLRAEIAISIAKACKADGARSARAVDWFKSEFDSKLIPVKYEPVLKLAAHSPEGATFDCLLSTLWVQAFMGRGRVRKYIRNCGEYFRNASTRAGLSRK